MDYLPTYRTETTSNIFQLTAGLRGQLPLRDWTWEVYGSHGNTNVNARLPEGFPRWRTCRHCSAPTSTARAGPTRSRWW